ncbi:hypothetical protein E1A91_D05G280500v1 [Gossypium mustelinum]|uniref:Uncharacterized protein n=1 Tax=Gossypium mustelinum TaxID=34275 RepID=A0A5D2V1M7_GOSMU|nr:hypothetical protein E1A91_D05G280500v1 [Gossypium mustelinum]
MSRAHVEQKKEDEESEQRGCFTFLEIFVR